MVWPSVLLILFPVVGVCTNFTNPVVEEDAPDPGVMKFGDTWYMVSTGGSVEDGFGAFQIRTSHDLVNWEATSMVFPCGGLPEWSGPGADYWAPELHQVGDNYLVYFTARDSDLCFGMPGDFEGDDVLAADCEGETQQEKDASCCALCQENPDCEFWVRKVSDNRCWLKKNFRRVNTSDSTTRGNLRDPVGRLAVGVGVADDPAGPYTDIGAPLVISDGEGQGNGDDGMALDPHFFKDRNTGKQYLLWKRNQIPKAGVPATVYIRELESCGTKFARDSKEIALLTPEYPWEGDCVEAPWLVQRDDEYFLFYSAETTFATKYTVGVARSSSVLGPYIKSCAPILSQFASDSSASVRKFASPGHCSVVETEQGYAIIYHAFRADAIGDDRVPLVDRLTWGADGWPRVGSCGTPTIDPQPMPEEPATEPPCIQIGRTYQLGWNADTSPMTRGKSFFRVREGNCPGGSISFQPVDRPGQFVRHENGTLRVDNATLDNVFVMDSSFMASPGLALNDPATTSLRPVNSPYDFVLRLNGTVAEFAFQEDPFYFAAATWKHQEKEEVVFA
eukprot:TRINITY_DN50544_c0_g1_i1.p1 TRINITY_DN50544_c0_g1~~TRINITY_DN50544_c0_g1_i1.p1  ORF type:complete len:562 (-),score=58.35 TRINITY_DN50544_c0_g1_i1:172-1857(-)